MTKKTLPAIKYWLTAILLFLCITGIQAQSGTYKNTTGVSGNASLGAVPVTDISFANYQFPMIGIALAASPAAIQSDGSYNITYTYTIKNYGGIALTQVQVNTDLTATFASPMAFTVQSRNFTGISGNNAFTGSGANTQLLSSGATLAAGTTATATVVINLKNNGQYGTFNATATATATAGSGTVTDASVNGTNPDANGNGVPMDDTSPTPVTISRPDIEVTKTASQLSPYVGDNVVFTITATNRGTGDAVNVQINELPDNGFSLVAATPTAGSYDAATKIWTISKFNAGATAKLTYSMLVNATGPYSNTASSNHPEDNNGSNNSASVTLTPKPSADIQIKKTVDKTNPDVLSTVTYTLTALNNGPSDADNVVVKDKLPTGIEPIAPLPSGMTYDAAQRQFTWSLGTMPVNIAQTQTIVAQVQADIDRSNFTNTATITTTDYDPKTTNNSSSVTIIPKEAVDLSITKEVFTTTNPVYPLDPVTFVIKVKNLGPNNCYDANVTDLLTSGYTLTSATPSQGAYTAGTGLWKIGTLLKDQEVTLTIKATITATVNYGNTATTSTTDNDNNPGNNSASITPPPVRPRTDLQVTITPTGTPDVGNNMTFTITVKNNGPSPSTGVILDNVLLPNGYTFVSKNQAGYNQTTGVWNIGNLALNGTTTLVLVGKLLPNATNYNLNAHVSGTEDETTLVNNTATTNLTINQVANIAVTKTIDNNKPEVGQQVNFTITVVNNGPSTATNVVVTEDNPSGYQFNTFTPSAGTYSNGVWTIGTMASGATVTLQIKATVLPDGNYKNTVVGTLTEKDNNPANNTASVTATVTQLADLSILKTINNNNPDAGSNVQFTLTAKNSGPGKATNVKVTDLLPGGYTFVAASPSGVYNNTTGIWTIGTLAKDQTSSLTISATVKPTGTYTNSATIAGTEKDPDITNNNSSVTPVVRPVADLQITKTVNNSTADAGTDVIFNLKAENKGVSDATGVVVNDLLPDGFTFKSASPTGQYDPGTGVWTIGALAANGVKNLTITATVRPTGSYVNTATIGGTTYDPISTNNSSSVTVTVTPVTDLAVTKTANNNTPDAGSAVTFTITATNLGISDATGVTVTDALPNGYTFIQASTTTGSVSGNTWTIGNMNAGAVATLTVKAVVNASGNYTNTATIAGNEADRNPANNSSTVTPVPTPVTNLTVEKAIDQSTVFVGDQVVFTIKVTNNGFSTAANVILTDLLKNGYAYVSHLQNGGSGTYNPATGNWSAGSLASGQTITLKITAKVLVSGDYNNTATVTSDTRDTDPSDNSAAITPPTVKPVTDLAIIKTVDNSSVDAGSTVVFTLTATNNGISNATQVVATDLLPSGYTFVKAVPAAAYDNTTGKWTIGNLANGAGSTLKITATVNPTGNYTNTATITGAETDPNTANNSSSVTVSMVPVADLEVIKSVDNTTPDVGTHIIFTIKAINHGVSKATGVTVADVLQNGYALVSANASAGTYNNGAWTIGDLEKDAAATLTITAKVLATGSYSNTATISGNEADRNTTNNSSTVTPVPVPVANVSIVKTISNSTPDVGGSVTFTITAANAGLSDATGVTVTDILQSGYQLQSAAPSAGTYNAATGSWNIGTMTNGQSATLVITAKVLPTGNYNNTATISSPVKDTDPSDNTSTINTPVVRAMADLSIIKNVNNNTADAGSQVTFTITATNNGPSTASGVVVNDRLPSGYTFVSANPAAAYDATTGKWTIGTLNSGDHQTLTITAILQAQGDYTNTATVAGNEYDPNTTNNSSSVTVSTVPVADLEVIKSVDNNTPDVGTNVIFTIKAINHGPSKATGVTVADVLQSGYALVSANASAGTYNNGAWTIGELEKDATATLTITAKVLATGSYSNTAAISGNEADRNTTNNSSTVTPVPVPVANVSVVKTISNSTPDVGSSVTFTITAANAGPGDATGVTVTDMLQSGYQLQSAAPSAGSYNAATGIWSIGRLNNGQQTILTITATVLPTGDYTNKAVIKANEKDKTPSDDISSITPPVPVPVADLQVIKTISNNTPGTGSKVSFKVVVTNNGPSTATNVTVTDVMQNGFTLRQSAADKGNFVAGTGIWTIGALNAGEKATLQIEAQVNTTGTYTNTAQVKGDEKDPDNSNNSSTVSIQPDPVVDLRVSKSVSNMTPPHGADVTFTIVAGNDGPSNSTGITVTDILPSGYTFKSATTTTGSYSAGTGIWTIGSLPKDATATLTVTATVNKTGNYTNTAAIKGNETDGNPANNSSSVTPVPVPLHTNDDAASTEEPDPVTIDIVKNDVYGNTGHTVYIKDKPLHGTVTDKGDGTVVYTPDAGFGGTDYFTYYIQDQSGIASNVSTVTIDVTKRQVDLSIKKVIVTPPAEIIVGKNITFELTATNNSRKGASGVVVTDILANNVGDTEIKTESEHGEKGYDPATKTISWKIDTLAPGQTVKLLVTAKLLSGGQVENTATVAGKNADPNPDNNTASVSTSVKGADIFVPTAFTPNGDGINDKFVILGIDRYPNSQLIIWNRWGNVVYRSGNYHNEWDGSGLNEGTYYYELNCPSANGKISLKGWIQLVR